MDSFLAVAKRSDLVSAEQLQKLLESYRHGGGDGEDARGFSDYLVKQKALTGWQADKLMQGKHKGFFLGKYKLLSLLGKGGMSSVYLAEHVLMRRRCAIKVLPAKKVHDTSYLGRFHREAQAVAALDHPNIVRAYDIDHEVDGDMEIHFLVMEYVEGKSLLDLVLKEGPQSPVRSAHFIRQAALGLKHAHEAGLVHRDIKPGNLLVDSSATVKLLDLGLARFFLGADEQSLTIQHDEKVLGTADYLAPEQAVDSHLVDARGDIYSLGCTLYFLLTGHPPFTDGTLAQRLLAHQTKEPPPIEGERRDVPASLLTILRRMMAKKPDDRYQKAGDVSAALQDWLNQHGGPEWQRLTQQSSLRLSPSDSGPRPAVAGSGSGAGSSAVRGPSPVSREQSALDAFVSHISAIDSGTLPPTSAARTNPAAASARGTAPPPRPHSSAPVGSSPARPGPASSTATRAGGRPSGAAAASSSAAAYGIETDKVNALPSETAIIPGATPPAEAPRAGARDVLEPAVFASPPPVGELHVDVSSEPPSSGISSYRHRKKPPSATLITVAAAAAVMVVLGIILAMSGGRDGKGPVNPPPRGNKTAPDEPSTPKKLPLNLGPELTVGPGKEIETIGGALDYVREHATSLASGQTWSIEVAGGQEYDDRIVIDSSMPRGLRIECRDLSRAVLKPQDAGPVISVSTSERITIEGFDVDASGRDTAVRVSGGCAGTRLARLEVTHFTGAGLSIEATGLQGSPLQLSELLLVGDSPEAVGMRFGDVRLASMDQCRIAGLRIGMEFSADAWCSGVTVRQCRFHNVQTAVRFAGAPIDFQTVAFVNNTFDGVQQSGIVFETLPPEGSPGLRFVHNLFSDVHGPEARVVNGFDADKAQALLAAGEVRHNWSERPAAGPGELDLFVGDGRRGIEPVTYVSRGARDVEFLRPTSPDVRIEAPAAGAERFVGAVAP
jgi:serine/threonine-protein kinase